MTEPAHLVGHTLIDVSTRPTEWDRFLEHFGVRRRQAGKRLSFSNTSLAVGAAMEDLGIALADRRLIAREVRYGQLVRPLGIALTLKQGFYLVHPQGRPLNDGMRAFRDWLLGEIEQQRAEEQAAG
jgi:LysR family glycine cleavage system transcriptional activator